MIFPWLFPTEPINEETDIQSAGPKHGNLLLLSELLLPPRCAKFIKILPRMRHMKYVKLGKKNSLIAFMMFIYKFTINNFMFILFVFLN
jgi:hypothetical protein